MVTAIMWLTQDTNPCLSQQSVSFWSSRRHCVKLCYKTGRVHVSRYQWCSKRQSSGSRQRKAPLCCPAQDIFFPPTTNSASEDRRQQTADIALDFFYSAYYCVYFVFSSLYALFDLLPKPLYHACFLSVLIICTYCTYLDIYMNVCVLWSAFIEVQLGDLFKCQYSSLWYYLLFVLYTFFFSLFNDIFVEDKVLFFIYGLYCCQ